MPMTIGQLVYQPANIQSQNVSQELPLAFWMTGAPLPTTIPTDQPIPGGSDFSTKTEELDLFRVLFLALGIVIGVKVLK